MITNDEQLNQAVERLGCTYRAMAALRAEVLPVHARRFALMAEGPVDEIRRLQAQIDGYIYECYNGERSKETFGSSD